MAPHVRSRRRQAPSSAPRDTQVYDQLLVEARREDESASKESQSVAITRNGTDVGEAAQSQHESSDSDDVLEFENVQFGGIPHISDTVSVLVDEKPAISRKQKFATVDRKARLIAHKIHLCCLITHAYIRNAWCNDAAVQMLDQNTLSYLNPDASLSQFQRSRSFVDGLVKASDAFRLAFTITKPGSQRARWVSSGLQDDAVTRSEFARISRTRKGSRDEGVQLFCAMLRSAGVDTRLVYSPQVLPLRGLVSAMPKDDIGKSTGATVAPPAISLRRFGKHRTSPDLGKALLESAYPIYWVEAFNTATQMWQPVDPLVTHTTGKPAKLEPPASDSRNNMSYVIAFETNGSAKDVTRRYAKAFNAKTRKMRVDSAWFNKLMKHFETEQTVSRFADALTQDRDQIEDAQLAHREASEPMPHNVQDFKDHPIYALERLLHHDQAIFPRTQIGTIRSKDATEAVFRRADVVTVKSATKWFSVGRVIKQALKRSANGNIGLYSELQTRLHVPPAIVNGHVPRNEFGNLDVYVPTLIPAGGVHVRAREGVKAARLLGVDYAEAVTGFRFKRRQGTAVTLGVIVAKETAAAVAETVSAMRWQQHLDDCQKHTLTILRLWKRFVVGLRIVERIRVQTDEFEGVEDESSEAGNDLGFGQSVDSFELPSVDPVFFSKVWEQTSPDFEANDITCVSSPWNDDISATVYADESRNTNRPAQEPQHDGYDGVFTVSELAHYKRLEERPAAAACEETHNGSKEATIDDLRSTQTPSQLPLAHDALTRTSDATQMTAERLAQDSSNNDEDIDGSLVSHDPDDEEAEPDWI